jgi:hypothetical protein
MLNRTVCFHFFKAKYDFYILRDLAEYTLNKIHFYIFFTRENIFRNFGNFKDFDEKRVF